MICIRLCLLYSGWDRDETYFSLVAMDQHWMTGRVQHDLLDIDDRLDGNDYGRGFVRWDQDANMSNTGFFNIFVELGRVLGVDQGAVTH